MNGIVTNLRLARPLKNEIYILDVFNRRLKSGKSFLKNYRKRLMSAQNRETLVCNARNTLRLYLSFDDGFNGKYDEFVHLISPMWMRPAE